MQGRPIWTPDTSALNRLADDPDSDALIAGLRTGGLHVRLTFTSVSAVISNEDAERRRKLHRVCRLLLFSAGDCIDPQHEILKKMVARFELAPSFDWREVSVDFPAAQDEIARRETFSDEEAKQEREEQEELKNQFVQVYENAKPAFDRLFKDGVEKVPET